MLAAVGARCSHSRDAAMDPLMTTDPLLGMWLRGVHAWTRMARF